MTELRPGLKDVRRPAEPDHAYIVLSLLTGLRTEEARALRWVHVDLDGDPAAALPVPPHVAVWRSVRHPRRHQDRAVPPHPRPPPGGGPGAARLVRASQAGERLAAWDGWHDTGLVFTNHLGAALDAGNVRKMFKRICTEAGAGDGWTPRELRTTFVSLLSHRGVSMRDRPPGRARLHPHHRDRLPARAAAGDHHRRRDHGRALRSKLGHSARQVGLHRHARNPLTTGACHSCQPGGTAPLGLTGDSHQGDAIGHYAM